MNAQRLASPSGPHFIIHQPQLTWLNSTASRITGAGLSISLYDFSLAKLLKIIEKTIMVTLFTFHSLDGLLHLAWETGIIIFSCTFCL
ncbi:hypothetical protein H4582DRAFT_1978454 [Lactarius indigo]|nr:hypothetical protein H4582DRAFT_1978454 [Lactarius indigo]